MGIATVATMFLVCSIDSVATVAIYIYIYIYIY